MNHLEPAPTTGAADLAFTTWEEVHGPNGEATEATKVLGIAFDGLRHLQKYQPASQAEYTHLEAAVRSLQAMIDQREATANEFVEAAIAEIA